MLFDSDSSELCNMRRALTSSSSSPRTSAHSVSKEEPVTDNHDIVPDGYDIGRNELVAAAMGTTSFGGITYSTTAENITGLMAAGSDGVNHGASAS